MKNIQKLKLILIILICITIILIGFIGIYAKKGGLYKNILPKYNLASDINGSTVIELEIDKSTEKEYYDKEGKKVDSAEVENEADYEIKEILINEEENLNKENYIKTLEIMKKRLDFLGADQYSLDLDENSGKIVLTIEDDYIEDVESILPMEGKFQLLDSDTQEVIIDYEDFKSAKANYASLEDGYTTYIDLKLKDSSIEKVNTFLEKTIANETSLENEEEKDETIEDTNIKKVKVMFDSDEICEVDYSAINLIGKTLRVITDEYLTENSQINSRINIDTVVSKLATFGRLPVIYNITSEEFIQSTVQYNLNYVVIVLICLSVIISIIFIIKYKLNGLLAVIAFNANSALFLIIIRLTNVSISLNGIVSIFALITAYTILNNNILKLIKDSNFKSSGEIIKLSYLKSINVLFISLIIFVVLSFAKMTVINSTGLILFWGWLITVLGNIVFTIPMLSIANKK